MRALSVYPQYRKRRLATVTADGCQTCALLSCEDAGVDCQPFLTLVDPTRRAILARLEREDSASISALAQPFVTKLPAVMKHLDVLDDAGLITRSKDGRTVTVRLQPEPMREAIDWPRRYERFWSKSLDRLAAYAESKEAETRKKRR